MLEIFRLSLPCHGQADHRFNIRLPRSFRSGILALALLSGGVAATNAAEYEILDFQDLGTLGSIGGTNPYGINEAGDVVGIGFTASGHQQAFRWSNGQIHTVPGMFSAFAINQNGDIVGDLQLEEYLAPDAQFPFRPTRAALFRNGSLINLGSLDDDDPHSSGWMAAINNNGATVGTADAGRAPDYNLTGKYEPGRAVFSNGSGLAALSEFGGADEASSANDINDAGQIVGERWISNNTIFRAYLRQPAGLAIDVTPAGAQYGQANSINENGDLVGTANGHAFLRRAGGTSEFLPNTLFASRSYPSGINDQGWIVGTYRQSGNNRDRAFFHDGTTMFDLNALAAQFLAGDGQTGIYRLSEATAINNGGKIIGYGKYRAPDGDDYWERGFIMTIVRKPPALLVHDVNILGEPHGFVAGAKVDLINDAGETAASLTCDAEGKAILPASLDLEALYTVEIMHEPGTTDGVSRDVWRTYQHIRPSEVADGSVKLALPVTLRAALDTELKKLESTGTLVMPYQTNGARALMAAWNNLSPRELSLHASRDQAMARLTAAANGLATVYGAVENLCLDTAKVICETILGLTSLRKTYAEMLEHLESQVATDVANSILDSDVARFAVSCMVISAQNAATAVQKTFIATLKTLAPGTASDLVDEALKVAIKGIVAGMESGQWEKKKGIEGGRAELLKDIATKIASEVGGRVFASAHVLATQEDFEIALARAETLQGEGTVTEARYAALSKAGQVEVKVGEALDYSATLDETSKSFDWVADLSAAVGRIPPAKIATLMATIIKTLNVAMSASAAGNDIDALLQISGTDTPEVTTLAFYPFPGGGGESLGTMSADDEETPATHSGGEELPGTHSEPSHTDAYRAALTTARNAVADSEPAALIISTGDSLLAEDAALNAFLDAQAERLATLANASTPPDPALAAAGLALGNARRGFAAASATLYPMLAGLVVPSLADPETTPADILAAFDAVATTLAAIDAALSESAVAGNGMSAPAKLVLGNHGLLNGAVGCRPGVITMSARILNAGDDAIGAITVTLTPAPFGGPIAPLRVTSPASVSLTELAPGASALVEWQALATDVSASGNGGSAEYRITAVAAGLEPATTEGAIGINGAGPRFEDWVGQALATDQPRGFADDADFDGVANGLERFLGGQPGTNDRRGLVIDPQGQPPRLRHQRAADPGPDVSAIYEWSPNLADWLPSGAAFGETTVVLNPVVIAGEGTEEKTIEITPQTTGNPSRLFFRIRLDQDSPPPPPPAPLTAPSIATGPDSPQSLSYGEPLALTVVATGTGPLFYQWLKDGVEIDGENDATLSIASVTTDNGGTYRVRVTGAAGTILSPDYEVVVSGGGGG